MELHKQPPNLFIYTPDQRVYKGMVVDPLDFTADYNFNALSQMQFRVNKYIYDTNTCSWIENPCYEHLNEHMVIKTSDTSNKFRFKGRTEKTYSLLKSQPNSRNSSWSSLGFKVALDNATLQDETELFNIGLASGYAWQYYSCIDDNGAFIDGSGNDFYFNRIACKEFFPVKVGDIISMGSKVDNDRHFNKDGEEHFSYRLHFYSSTNASSYIKRNTDDFALYNPVGRVRISEDMLGSNSTGYVRIEAQDCRAILGSDSVPWKGYSPNNDYVKIYSGERRCSAVQTNSPFDVDVSQCLWVVKSVDITKEYINEYKTVTLYSYEYVLSYKSLSLSESTLPLYIPDNIVTLVNSEDFCIDSVDGGNWYGAQRMSRGLINQVLDYLPDWTIGYINQNVITRYRTVSEVDNGNIYSFLINTIQPLYQCYFLFDTVKKTINILAQTDVAHIQSSTHLTWDNALKSLQVSNSDTSYVTALRVHTAEDQYGIGLVNPTGNNIIYDFSHIRDNLDFVVDPKHYKDENSGEAYTLKESVERYEQSISDTISGINKWGYSSTYRQSAQELIDLTLQKIKLESKLAERLDDYLKIADTINIYLQDDFTSSALLSTIMLTDVPRSLVSMQNDVANGDYSYYHSRTLYNKLYASAEVYFECYRNLKLLTIKLQQIQSHLKYISLIHSLDYKVLKAESDRCGDEFPYYPIFTPKEALALSYYIYEADWTDENAVFSNTYSAQDILSTLVDTYDNAQGELTDIYSKPTYEFKADLANVSATPEMQSALEDLYLGNALYIIDTRQLINPVLLSVHIDYSNPENFSMQLSTDYKRKPLELRFSDLFGTISQVSVETPTFTFDK